jgi:putative membrane protein
MDLQRELQVLLVSVAYALVGLALLFVAYKVFDALTPQRIDEAIFQRGNVAVAITVGSFILGISIVLSAALR